MYHRVQKLFLKITLFPSKICLFLHRFCSNFTLYILYMFHACITKHVLGMVKIDIFKIFAIRYNIDISLTVGYLNDIFTILPASQGSNLVKFSAASFGNFTNK